MDAHILRHLAEHEHVRGQLRTQFPDADDDMLRDTVEGLSSLPEILATLLRSHLDDMMLANALRSRLANMHERLSRIEGRAEKKRSLVAAVMERADLRKLSEPDFTVSLRPIQRPLVITADAEIPEAYWKPQPPKLDRKAILAALNGGDRVPGASLGNGGVTIAVRTR